MPYNANDFKPNGLVKKLPIDVGYNASLTTRAASIFQYTGADGKHYDKSVVPANQADHTFRYEGTLSAWGNPTNLALAMDKWEQVIPVTFTSSASTTPLLTVSAVNNLEMYNKTKNVWENSGGVTYRYDDDNNGVYERVDIILDTQDVASGALGTAGFQTMLHELGHALGIDHPFDEGNPLDTNTGYNANNTIMAYLPGSVVRNPVFATSPMIYDVKYVQENGYIPLAYNSSATLYSFSTTADVKLTGDNSAWTIWDTGGTDTIDASGTPYGDAVKIDLRGGVDADGTPRFSEINKLPGFGQTTTTEYIAIAFDSRNASGVVDIEKAIGGAGNDTIIGGYVANTLQGGAGNDKVYDPSSKTISGDYLYGDTPGSTLAGGNDTLWGGSNTFLYGGGGANDNATCTRIAA